MVLVLKTGVSVPLPIVKAESLALVEGRITFKLYVILVVPSCAVTTVVIALEPTFKAMAAEALPDVTAVPSTVMVAVGSAAVGVMVTDAVPLVTISV